MQPSACRWSGARHRGLLDKNPFTTVEHGMGFDVFLGAESRDEPLPLQVQRRAASYAGCRPEEIALTDSTTQVLALIGEAQAAHMIEDWRSLVIVCEKGELRRGYTRARKPR